ncbi:MAG: rhodanese-like domain-containing protein [Lacipirellulaceae bacterium]
MTPIEVSCQDVKRLIDGGAPMLLVDCRGADEHATASIAGARLVPMAEIPAAVAELAAAEGAGKQVVVHCHHGMRSRRTAEWLRENSVGGAQSMAGGIDAWSTEIDPGVPRY